MKKNLLWVAVGAVLLAGCDEEVAHKGAAAGAGAQMPPAQVEVVMPAMVQQRETLRLPGRLQAVRTAQVRARVEGIVERRVFKEGSDVKAGDMLFQIDPKVLQANVQSAKATLMKAQADVKIATQTAKRLSALVPEKAASQQDLDNANATLARAQADVESAKAALSRAEIDLGYARVTAPISGRIGRALVTEGALVGKGEATPMAVVEQVNPIWVNFSLSSNQYAQLREQVDAEANAGSKQIHLLLANGKAYTQAGQLLFSDPAVDPSTGSVGLRAEFANPNRELLPGQFVDVSLPISDEKTWLTVPQKAVLASPQGQVVMTVSAENKVVPRPIKTGKLVNGAWVVTEGLKGDEQVIVNGLQKVRPGAAVMAVPMGASPAAPGGKS